MCLEKKLSGKKLLLTKKSFFITVFFIIVFGTGFAKDNYVTNPDGTTHYAYFTPDPKEEGDGGDSGGESTEDSGTTPEGDPPPSTTPPEEPSAPTTPEEPGGNGGSGSGGSGGSSSGGSGNGGSGSGGSGSGSGSGSGGSSGSGSGGSGSSGSGGSGGSSGSGGSGSSGSGSGSGSGGGSAGSGSGSSGGSGSSSEGESGGGTTNVDAQESDYCETVEGNNEAATQILVEEISAKEESVNQLRQELSNEYKKYGAAGIKQESLNAMARLQQEVAREKQDREEKKEAVKNEKQKQKAEKSSKVDGDPVRLTVGCYEQEETDFYINGVQKFEITRKYKSDNSIVSTFGFGWISNLDQRIIAGVEASAQASYDKLLSSLNEAQQVIMASKQDIIKGYGLSSIENGEMEINASINRCREIKFGALAVLEELNSESFSDAPEAVQTDLSNAKENAQNLAEEAEAKAVAFELELEAFRHDVSQLAQMQAEYNQKQREADDFYANIVSPSISRHQKNSFALFTGMKNDYDETGLDTLTFIDEDGYPHLLYETASGSGEWKSSTEKEIEKCGKTSGGYRLFMKDGSLRDFDENGFIKRLSDRNGNYVEIKRDSDEKIKSLETSSGEKYSFTYNGSFVSKITNVSSSDENAIYTYRGNFLESVKDTDGDVVTMSYDSDGKMTSLNKCDGSSVQFIYGEQTSDGKILATATINEEGFAESFEYDRAAKRTDYVDHDGNRTSCWYDDSHRTIREQRPDGTDIINSYDEDGNLASINQNGNITLCSYDSDGNKLSAYYSDGTAEYWTYGSFNLVTSHTDRDGVKEEYLRDNRGNIREYRLGGKTVYLQDFDTKGQVIKKTVYGEKPLVTHFTYDSHGNLKSESCGGITTEYEYDNRNRLLKKSRAGKLIEKYDYYDHKIIQRNSNGLETSYLTNGRKDLVKIIQKDTVTGIIHETRLEYDKRHLPLKVFCGDGENEKPLVSYLYTPEGKLRAEAYYGSEVWVKLYEYKGGQIFDFRQFKVSAPFRVSELVENSITEQKLKNLLSASGDEVFSQKYEYRFLGGSRKLLIVTDAPGITNLFEYDCFGNLVKKTDGNGKIRESFYRGGYLTREQGTHGGWFDYEYSDGRMTSAGEQGGSSLEILYYPDGSIKSSRDRYGKTTYYHYDEIGRVINVQNEVKKIWYEYDAFDRITKKIIGNSADEKTSLYYETYEYSNDGRKIVVTKGGKYKRIYDLDAYGNVVKEIVGNANERSFVYNYLNQLTESYDGYGNKTLYEYNALGEISKVILPDGSETEYEFNYMGQLVKISDDCGTVYSADYDKAGRLIKGRSRGDSERTYEYDRGGRLIKSLCGGQLVESYTYGNNNRTITVRDGNGYDYIYKYDAFGRLVNERNRKNLEQNYFYDEEGIVKSENTFDGGTCTLEWSNDRSVKTIRYSDGSENCFLYDMTGNIIESKNAYGNTQYTYDQGGRLVYQKDVTSGEELYFEYDESGNRSRLYSSNRETLYTYGKNNEVKEIFDNKQRVSIKLSYDKNGREVLRQFGNGTVEETLYDRAGRVIVKMQKDYRDELLWGEGYVYGADGKRTATVDNVGRITFYEYNSKGQLSAVYYPYTEEMEIKLKAEAQTNGLPVTDISGENRFLTSSEKSDFVQRLNAMKYGLAYNLPAMHVVLKESYEYDGNGNRISKITPCGKIEYSYDRENCLLSSGSKGQRYVTFSYDKMGNLLAEESAEKSVKYAYNSENRMIYCVVTDRAAKEYAQTSYSYDAFGRRILVEDIGEAALRTLYDGLSFDIIKQSPIFENGLFTDSNNTGIRWGSTGQPTGDRYRYLENDSKDDNRYIYLNDDSYKTVSSRYRGERTAITVNNTIAAQTTSDYDTEYFVTDLLGSVSCITGPTGSLKSSFTYDAFGSLVQGKLTGTSDFGYLGKQKDPTSTLYNYGYRDYTPQLSRFTTPDPIRDGPNWFSYCNSDPVNFVDLWGLNASDKVKMYVYRNTNSYNISTDRKNPKNTRLDKILLQNTETGEYKVFSNVQTVANYPSTDPDDKKVESCFLDTIGTAGFELKVYTTTNVAAGTAAVITNTRTIDGRKVDQNGYTEGGKSEGRGLVHSDEKPDKKGERYTTPYSKQCFILPTEENDSFFETLRALGVKEGESIKGTVYDVDRRDR